MKLRTAVVLATVAAVLTVFGLTEHFRHNALDAQLRAQRDTTRQRLAERAEALRAADSLRGALIVAHAATEAAQARADSAVTNSDRIRRTVKTVDSTHVLVIDSLGVAVVHPVPVGVTVRFAVDSMSIASLQTLVQKKDSEIGAERLEKVKLYDVIGLDSLAILSLQRENGTLERMKRPRIGFKTGVVVGVGATALVVKIVRALVKKPP